MVNAGSGHRSPIGASVYGSIAGDAWYRAQYLLQDQKLGHYMHIPPKTVFFSQMMGTMVGVPINYGAIRWVLDNKMQYLNGTKEDPNHQWTGQYLAGSLTAGIQYVLVVSCPPLSRFKIQPDAFFRAQQSSSANKSTSPSHTASSSAPSHPPRSTSSPAAFPKRNSTSGTPPSSSAASAPSTATSVPATSPPSSAAS